jgi:SET domain-containing protein
MKNLSWLNPKAIVKCSSIDKKGVFAKKLIKKGEIISVSGGAIVDEKEYKKLKKGKFKKIDEYSLKVADGFYLVSHKKGELETDDFFNHSCNPNAGYKGHLLVVAMRDIKPKEEITYDYAMTDCDKEDYFKCHCGAKNCRGVVTGDDWKKPELQRRYKGYFSWYIQEKINKLRKRRTS